MNCRAGVSIYHFLTAFLLLATVCQAQQSGAGTVTPQEGDYFLRDFHFKSGETMPQLQLHYLTLGKPVRDAKGRVTNAVLILHGTGGSGRQFLAPQFAEVLFGPASYLTRVATSSCFQTILAMEGRASRAMACTRASRTMTMTTWSRRSTNYWRRDSTSITCD